MCLPLPQVECHPYLSQVDLLSHCRSVKLLFVLYSELTSTNTIQTVSVRVKCVLSQVSVSLCDSLQSPGQWGQTLGLPRWTKSATGPSTGCHRPEISENGRPDHTQVGPTCSQSGKEKLKTGCDLLNNYFLGSFRQVACAEGYCVYPEKCDTLQDPAELASVWLFPVRRWHETGHILQPQRALHCARSRGHWSSHILIKRRLFTDLRTTIIHNVYKLQ